MKRTILVFALCVVGIGSWAGVLAQDPLDQRGQYQAQRALQQLLYPPDLIMRNQSVLNLSEEQRQTILGEVQGATSKFTALRWDLLDGLQKLVAMVEDQQMEEDQLMAQLDKVLDLEREVKRAQLSLAVRIRKTLDSEQLEKLEELRAERGAGARRRGRQPQRQ
jgi:Spy/CpxP family protein refolding chaperone